MILNQCVRVLIDGVMFNEITAKCTAQSKCLIIISKLYCPKRDQELSNGTQAQILVIIENELH